MRRVRWTNDARDDVVAIAAHIAKDNPTAARRVSAHIREVAARLGEIPAGRAGRVTGTYEAPIAGLPYILSFTLNKNRNELLVLRIIHGARDWAPESWPD